MAGTALGVGVAVRGRPSPTDTASAGVAFGRSALGDYTIVFAGPRGVQLTSLDGSRRSEPLTTATGPPLETSAGVLFVHSGWAYLLASPFAGPPRPLFPADGLFPMLWPATVGIDRSTGTGRVSAFYVNLEGPNPSQSPGWQFPAGYRPVGQVLASGPDGVLRTWMPSGDGHVQLGRPIGDASAVLGSAGSTVAWLDAHRCAPDGECTLNMSDTTSTTEPTGRVIPPLAGQFGYLPGGALSPAGDLLATFVPASPDRGSQEQLVVIDTTTSRATVVADSTISIANGPGSAQWTPDGSYVLFSGPDGPMRAYHPGDPRPTRLDISGSGSFAVAY